MTNETDVSTQGELPAVGLGTWKNDEPKTCADSVETALEVGYRHIDTAQVYGNEKAVGAGIDSSSVDREDVFLATKLWIDNLGYDDVFEAAAESLDRLGTEYLDVLYIHWPAGEYEPDETLPAFEELRSDGIINHIGVSNFEPEHIETAQEILDAPIFANQVEIHPQLQQRRLREFCSKAGIELIAYSPLAKGRVFELETLSEIAESHGVSEAQVSLAWLRQNGIASIPKATGAEHIRENWASQELELDEEELARIDSMDEQHRYVTPEFGPDSW